MGSLFFLIIIAVLGGVSLGINRALLGRLGASLGPAYASVINHIGGAIFIFIILLISSNNFNTEFYTSAPTYAYIGGIIGALFVALTSWLIPKAGVVKTSILLISGQMLCSGGLDYFLGKIKNPTSVIIGLLLILGGVVIGELSKNKRLASLKS